MKKSKFFALAITFLTMGLMSSCLGDDDGYKYEAKYPAFNAVVANDGTVTLTSGSALNVKWNMTSNKADIEMIGLKLPDGTNFGALKFEGEKWAFDSKGWMSVQAKDLVPSAESGYSGNLVFDTFTVCTMPRAYNGVEFPPCFYADYVVNNQYIVHTISSEIIEIGDTRSTDSTGKQYVQPAASPALYYVIFDADRAKAYVVIQGAQFYEGMKAEIVKLAELDMNVTTDGMVILSANRVNPTLLKTSDRVDSAGTPYAGVTVTNYMLRYVPSSGLSMNFNVNYDATDKEDARSYNIDFKCVYYDPTATTN